MKLEMGESLMASWLRHVYGCQIVQLNWKPSLMWDNCISEKEIANLYKQLKKNFKTDLELEFASKKMKSSQLILQGEVDCLGIKLELEHENALMVDKVYAVDIAFHENGLNYGAIDDTCSRIYKKYIRTALTIYQFFGIKQKAVIIFATPKVLNGHIEQLKKVALDVKTKFTELGFKYDFQLFCNEDFTTEIFNPVHENINQIADTSELFIRSLKLVNLMSSNTEIPNSGKTFQNLTETKLDIATVTELPIGITAKKIFQKLSIENGLTLKEVENLSSLEYSKKTFGLQFPALIKSTSDEECGFINGNRRYYANSYQFNDQTYLLCNHWYEVNRNQLEKWLSKLLN